MARRPKKPDAPKKPKNKSVGGGGTATQTPERADALQKVQMMREILETKTQSSLEGTPASEIIESYAGLAEDMGLADLSLQEAHQQVMNPESAPQTVAAEAEPVVTDNAEVGVSDTVDDEFVSSEPDYDRDMPSPDDLDAGGDDPDRLQRLLDASQLTDKARRADPDLGPFVAGKSRTRTSQAAAEIEEFLNANGYKITAVGRISPAKTAKKPKVTENPDDVAINERANIKGKNNRPKPSKGNLETVSSTTDERIDGGDQLDNAAPADLGDTKPEPKRKPVDAGPSYNPFDKSVPNEKPKKGAKKSQPSGQWYSEYIPEKMTRDETIWAAQNDPGPSDPEAASAFLNELNAKMSAREAEVNATRKTTATEEKTRKQEELDKATKEGKRNKTNRNRKIGGTALIAAETAREMATNSSRQDQQAQSDPSMDGKDFFTEPTASEPVLSLIRQLAGPPRDSEPQQRRQENNVTPNRVIDKFMGRRASPFSRVLEDFGPPPNAPGRRSSPADIKGSPEDTIRQNRPNQ